MTPRRQPSLAASVSATPVAAVLATALLAVALLAAAVLPARASAGAFVNPSSAEIRSLLRDAAVAHDIPPRILYAIAFQESSWRQFDANGDPLIGSDGVGIGIMQVTSSVDGVDRDRLRTDIAYNIDVGTGILDAKWAYAPSVFPVIGGGDRRCYEDWFFAVWAYNGWKAGNLYPYLIWGHVADGRGLWTGLVVTPVPATSLVGGFPPEGVAVPTPQPEHWWSAVPLPKPALGRPQARRRVAAGRRFTVSGALSPIHPAGAHSVVLNAYRWNGATWKLRRALLTTNRDAGDGTRWVVTFALGRTGRWKLQAAALPDADHAAAVSRAAVVTVVR
jgi:hypothetical protein